MVVALTDDQIALLQAFIDDTPPGEYEAVPLIRKGFEEYFSEPKKHGEQFKAAVSQKRLRNVESVRFDMGSKHYWYVLHRDTPS